ncbi:MAG TPA: hypothetical protein VH413_01695 [Verrucomicrobiae bacterium]|jgi:hypothetical protein|nr:hypothetical protein [Verrucomicrobiae bacterium]
MPNENTDAEAALKKLGHRVRLGWAKKHPIPDKSLESVKNTVREQWEQEQTASKPAPSPAKDQKPKPPEPGIER